MQLNQLNNDFKPHNFQGKIPNYYTPFSRTFTAVSRAIFFNLPCLEIKVSNFKNNSIKQ